MGRFFPDDEEQKEAARKLERKLRLKRLKRNGASEADVIAFTVSRLRRYAPGETSTRAYD